MPINYTAQQFPVEAYSFQTWASQDIGSLSNMLWNGMSEYSYVTDGYPDNGNLPLKLELSPIDITEYVVSASEFSLGKNNGEGTVLPEAIISQGSNFNTGFRWTAEGSPEAMPLYDGTNTIVDRIEFWDTSAPGTIGNKVLVYAWLKPSVSVGLNNIDITLDIDGDAFQNPAVDNPFYQSLTASVYQVPEGGFVTFTLTTINIPSGTLVAWKAIGDVNINDLQGPGNACAEWTDVPEEEAGFRTGTITIDPSYSTSANGLAITEWTIQICEDNILEGGEYLIMQLYPLDSNGVLTQELNTTVLIDDTTVPLVGCTNPTALNYNVEVNIPCTPQISEWLTQQGLDPNGDFDCVSNPNLPELGIQSGVNCCCEIPLLGCTSSTACNYNPLANQNDGSCVWPNTYYDCDGNCINDSDGDGICDELEYVPDPAWECDDCPPCIFGCTDPDALNYNPSANVPCLTSGGSLLSLEQLENFNGDWDNIQQAYNCVFLDIFTPGTVSTYPPINNYWSNCLQENASTQASSSVQPGCVYPAPYNPCNEYICGCMNNNASNYNPAAEIDDGSCVFPTVKSTFYFVNDFGGTYGNDLTYLPNMEWPYYEAPNVIEAPLEGPIPPGNFGPPYATKMNKLQNTTDIQYIAGQINYSQVPAEGQTVYSKRSKTGGIGYGVELSTADWWDGTPGVQDIYQGSFDFGWNGPSGCVVGDYTCGDWEAVPRDLGDSWNSMGGFYIRPKQGYTVSRHNFYIDCERIRFSSAYSAQAAADHYSGYGKRMCCGSEPKSIMQSNNAGGQDKFKWTEGLGSWNSSTQQYETTIPPVMLASVSGPCCGSGTNTWTAGQANLNVSLDDFYTGGSAAKTNPRLKVQKTEYINPWVYIRPAGWNGTFVNSTGGTFPTGGNGSFPDSDLEPLQRVKLDSNGHPDENWLNNNNPGSTINGEGGTGDWDKYPVNNIFAAIEIWDMQPLNTWEWCENIYYDNNLPDDLPFGVSGVINDFIDGNCCTWENPNIHNLRYFGVTNNYSGENFIGGNPVTAYTGCNLGDLPYFDRSYICPPGDWYWMFQEGGAVEGDWDGFVDFVNTSQPGYLEKTKYCAPPDVLPDAGVNCSGYTNYGSNNYQGELPSCGDMNTSAENSNNPTSYFYDKFKQGVNSGIINPGDYKNNYLYIKTVRTAEFTGSGCDNFAPQNSWPAPKDGVRFYIKIKGEPMVCNVNNCEPSDDMYLDITD